MFWFKKEKENWEHLLIWRCIHTDYCFYPDQHQNVLSLKPTKSITVAVIFAFLKHSVFLWPSTQKNQRVFVLYSTEKELWPPHTVNLSEWWATDFCLFVWFDQYLTTSGTHSQSWERDDTERMLRDILEGRNLELIDWRPTRDRLSLKAEQLLAASFSQRGFSLFCVLIKHSSPASLHYWG